MSDEATGTGEDRPDGVQPVGMQVQKGLFGVTDSGDTSGFGGLVQATPFGAETPSTPEPLGGYFDEIVGALRELLGDDVTRAVVVDRGELTIHVAPDRLAEVCRALRDDEGLRFELCNSVSGVDYPDQRNRLHVIYHLTSMTYRRRVRLETAVGLEHPVVQSVTAVYPTADWQERETYDMFGVVFEGHPHLTRILMPDDWEGFPQRKDYPLGGIAVEYKGAHIPPPDERRAYK
ncbi:NADH-quinone oxidoreductase subunit C [Glycomyces sp. TRM65418]|uniref:NADH-quinone oxidoreductase subunit C n=1 Tax=Glycomyces sp. TRM65418 TaxID=2867006 RepID=UPI001CE69EE5|nr:NADH-quinone oxidoreductase subunit C [Glycomyces sp. TRM65418]MCC3763641.1 NADH-quinone oxidoreductase subunit C [Glycomyces sp. TRM65418]QZD57625.1 NADH-quinone oxidoreductase subunit C [Glycomyces sp. TRM65418]